MLAWAAGLQVPVGLFVFSGLEVVWSWCPHGLASVVSSSVELCPLDGIRKLPGCIKGCIPSKLRG